MFNCRVFADFKAATSASESDRRFLAALRQIRDITSARFVNFSVFDYGNGNPDTSHFLTYPIEWVSHYVRHCYTSIDPLLYLDYRKVSLIDWREAFIDDRQTKMFDRFSELGVGNEALSVVVNSGESVYTALALIFQMEPQRWPQFKREQLADFRLQAHFAAERHRELYRCPQDRIKPLTTRELQVLDLVARGNTDENIAKLIGIGKWTVVDHVQSAKLKLGCTNRTSAVATAITLGLISLKQAV